MNNFSECPVNLSLPVIIKNGKTLNLSFNIISKLGLESTAVVDAINLSDSLGNVYDYKITYALKKKDQSLSNIFLELTLDKSGMFVFRGSHIIISILTSSGYKFFAKYTISNSDKVVLEDVSSQLMSDDDNDKFGEEIIDAEPDNLDDETDESDVYIESDTINHRNMSYKALSALVDAILDDCNYVYFIKGSLSFELEKCFHKTVVEINSKSHDGKGKIIFELVSDQYDKLLQPNGLRLECYNTMFGDLEIDNSEFIFNENQLDRLTKLLNSGPEYYEYNELVKVYNSHSVFGNIEKMIRSGNLKFELDHEQEYEFEIGGSIFQGLFKTYSATIYDGPFIERYEYSGIDDEQLLLDMFDKVKSKKDEYIYQSAAPKLCISFSEEISDNFNENPCNIIEETCITSTITCPSREEIKKLHLNDDIDEVGHNNDQHQQDTSKNKKHTDQNNKKHIELKDVMVITSMAACEKKHHKLEKIRASVYVITRETLKKELQEFKAYYCDSCKRFYVLEETYKKLQKIGTICCRKYTLSELSKIGTNDWAPESILKMYGYSVSQKDGLSDMERRTVLDLVIKNNIMSKKQCIHHIEWCVRQNIRRANMELAINKWNKDIDYLKNGKTEFNDIRVGRIYTK
ncbi:hypothetical protein [Butyrivibrio fibrisolvens]|uniref:hypothetical protein n=1 Tax=Butyrivibrio fibrisolvens TaxID=831 RepID=UPI0003F6E0D7|nr:hypothetical protein [Butyrivibrio fibrisolvens]